jgi:predicted ATPase
LSQADWKRRKNQALFKFLLTERGKAWSQDQLVEALFPDLNPIKAAQNLRTRIYELRHLLEPDLLKGRASQYVLHAGSHLYALSKEAPLWIDTEAFSMLCAQAKKAEKLERWTEASEYYQSALALYRGDYLSEDLYEEWTIAPRREWRERYLLALSRLAECQARLGRYEQAIEVCTKLIYLAPSDERAYTQKMLFHFLTHETSQALYTYQSYAKQLKKELDLTPSAAIQKLYREIMNDTVNLASNPYPAPAGSAKHNLPLALTSFIGRANEVEEVKERLAAYRLVTIVGPGGAGKTRLALHVAAALVNRFSNGVWLLEFASLQDPKLLVQTVATALGLNEQPQISLEASLIDFLKPKRILLIFDNCEHLASACAELAEKLLKTCPELCLLATSREVLDIQGECIWSIPALSLPAEKNFTSIAQINESDAVRLFVERARQSQSHFALNEQNASLVAQICRQLEGLPLAIELAATRLRALSIEQIAVRLDARLEFLAGHQRIVPSRHRTLRATMDWSFGLLNESEKTLLRRLAVFSGGWSLEAAEAISCDAHLPAKQIVSLLGHLIDKSLIALSSGQKTARYTMLETTRQYSLEKLRESQELERISSKHLAYYLALAQQSNSLTQRVIQPALSEKRLNEEANLRAALQHAWQIAPQSGLEMAQALGNYWETTGNWTEGIEALRLGLQLCPDAPAFLRSCATSWVGYLMHRRGDYLLAKRWLQEGLSLARDCDNAIALVHALEGLGMLAWAEADLSAVQILYEEMLTIAQTHGHTRGMFSALAELGDLAGQQKNYPLAQRYFDMSLEQSHRARTPEERADSYVCLGRIARRKDDLSEAQIFFEKSLEITRHLEDHSELPITLTNLAFLYTQQERYEAAILYHTEALGIYRHYGQKLGVAFAIRNIANTALRQGHYALAQRCYEESLLLRQGLGNAPGITYILEGLAMISVRQSCVERGARLLGAACALREKLGSYRQPADLTLLQEHIELAQAELGVEQYNALWDDGYTYTLDQAIAYALGRDETQGPLSRSLVLT